MDGMSYGGATNGPPPPDNRSFQPTLLIVALVILGALLSFLALRSAGTDTEENADGVVPIPGDEGASEGETTSTGPVTLAEPLRLLPVRAAAPGACVSPDPPAVIDDPKQEQCLTLDVTGGMEVTRLAGSRWEFSPAAATWVLAISFEERDAARFGDLTGQLAPEMPPRNQLAMVLGENGLLTAPMVTERLDGGQVEISGGLTQQEAHDLAERLGDA
jgi:SecD-like export protein